MTIINYYLNSRIENIMQFKKRKSHIQIALLGAAISKLRGVDADLMVAMEPMLSTRLSAIITDLQIALENVEEA